MKAFLVSVDYADILAATLPYNRHHFVAVHVVTAPGSKDADVARQHSASVYETDAFYRSGATFNKWAALEEALTAFGRYGWMCLMDADVLWPKEVRLELRIGQLVTPRRRMLYEWPGRAPPEDTWSVYPLHPQQAEFAGYSQIFHANDPVLGPPPWHELDWRHAGGADSIFQAKWDVRNKVRPSFEVLHIGDAGQNWCGRATPYLDGTRHPDSDARARMVRGFVRSRTRGPDRFRNEKL